MPEYAHYQAGLDDLKIPPHSIEAEQAVLGGLMLDSMQKIYGAEALLQELTIEP